MSTPWNPNDPIPSGQNPTNPADPSNPTVPQSGNVPAGDGWTQPTTPLNPAWGQQPTTPAGGFQAGPIPDAQPPVGSPVWPTGAPSQGKKGLLGSLFDFSFRHFATPHIVRIVYMVSMVLLTISGLGWIIASFAVMTSGEDGATLIGLLMLLSTPLVFLVYLAMIRMSMELYVAVTRLADDVGRIREELGRR